MSPVPIDQHYKIHELDLATDCTPEFREILAYWDSCRHGAFAPTWRAFDLLKFPYKQLRRCIVVDLPADGGPAWYRFFGSGIAASHGMEMTHRTSDDIEPEELRAHVLKQYRLVAEGRRPRLFITDIVVKDGLPLQRMILRMPLSDDAKRVTNVATFDDFGDFGHDLPGTPAGRD